MDDGTDARRHTLSSIFDFLAYPESSADRRCLAAATQRMTGGSNARADPLSS